MSRRQGIAYLCLSQARKYLGESFTFYFSIFRFVQNLFSIRQTSFKWIYGYQDARIAASRDLSNIQSALTIFFLSKGVIKTLNPQPSCWNEYIGQQRSDVYAFSRIHRKFNVFLRQRWQHGDNHFKIHSNAGKRIPKYLEENRSMGLHRNDSTISWTLIKKKIVVLSTTIRSYISNNKRVKLNNTTTRWPRSNQTPQEPNWKSAIRW